MKNWFLILLPLFFFFSGNAQPAEISIIDFYGLKTVTQQQVRQVLGVKEGDSMKNLDQFRVMQRLKDIPGVKDGHLATVCCDDVEGKWIVFIGISESPIVKAQYNPKPSGTDSLPASIIKTYNSFMDLLRQGVMSGNSGEENTEGHAMLTYAPAKPAQDTLIKYARANVPLIIQVLRNSKDPNQREVASWILPYSADKKSIVPELLHAVKDADETVRNNATRALATMASYANKTKNSGINIPAEPFVELTNSIVWTDRNKGLAVLMHLTEKRPPELMKELKEVSLHSLIEMARWKNPGHAGMSYLILARLADMPEDKIIPALYSKEKDASSEEMERKLLASG